MLKVADLQQMIDCFAQPMKSAGASQKVLEDFAAMSRGLDRFKERTIGEFNDFLQMASNFINDGTLPEPGQRRRASTPKAPAMSVEVACQRVMEIYERCTADPHLEFSVIENEVKTLEPMSVPQLKQLVEQLLMTMPPNMRTKQDLLKTIATAVKEGTLTFERKLNMRPGEPMPASSATSA